MKTEAIVMSVAINRARRDRHFVTVQGTLYSDVEITLSDSRLYPEFTVGQLVNVEITPAQQEQTNA